MKRHILLGLENELAGFLRRSTLRGAPPKRKPQIRAFHARNRLVFVFVCVLVFFESFYRVTGNGHQNTELRFVDLEHAELCLESPIHDISCYLSEIMVVRFSSDEKNTSS